MVVDAITAIEKELFDASRAGKEKYLAMTFIWASDRGIYTRLVDDLKNQFTMGHTTYPRNITAAYNLLLNYRVTRQPQQTTRIINDSESVPFATVEKPELTTVRCYRCQKKGNYASSCPTKSGDKEVAAATPVEGEVTEALQKLVLADPPEEYGD
jgi:hypothetical protein